MFIDKSSEVLIVVSVLMKVEEGEGWIRLVFLYKVLENIKLVLV